MWADCYIFSASHAPFHEAIGFLVFISLTPFRILQPPWSLVTAASL